MKYYKWECILGPLFKLFEATLELIVPLVVASLIDKGIATGDGAYIVKMCVVLVLLGIVGLAFSVTAQYFAAKALLKKTNTSVSSRAARGIPHKCSDDTIH